MVHGEERSSHSIAIHDGYIEVNASGKCTQTISASTRFFSNFTFNLIPEQDLHLVNEHAVKRLVTNDLVDGVDASRDLVSTSNTLIDHTRTTIP
jgi:hypothetical protein